MSNLSEDYVTGVADQFTDSITGKPEWDRIAALVYQQSLLSQSQPKPEPGGEGTPIVDALARMVVDATPFPLGADQEYEAIPAEDARDLEREAARLLSSQNVGAGEVVRVIEAAQALAPLLDEGWDEYDAPEDQNAGAKACDELVAAVAAMLAKDRT